MNRRTGNIFEYPAIIASHSAKSCVREVYEILYRVTLDYATRLLALYNTPHYYVSDTSAHTFSPCCKIYKLPTTNLLAVSSSGLKSALFVFYDAALPRFSILMKKRRIEGIRNTVNIVDIAIPPSTTLPNPRYSSEPGPGATTRGSMPKILVKALM